MNNFITPNEETHKYIIGIDFGHGETSADICNIQWNDNFLQLESPTPVEIFNGQKATKSVLLVEKGTDINNKPTSTYYVGQQAIERYINKHRQNGTNSSNESHFYCYFKQIPSLMEKDGTVEVMKQFMRGIYLQIRKQRSELTDNNHIVYIACPSNAKKWTNEELKKYAEIALDAGLPLAKIDDNSIGIIRESRAAFIKARSNPNSKFAIKDGILLIDFGSSTVDLTYYSSLYVEKPEDGGDDCGAYHVEDEVYNHLIQDVELAKQCSEDSKSTSSAMKLRIRETKEKYFRFNAEELEISLSADKLSRGKVSGNIDKYYSDDDINKMLTSYKSSIKKCFEDYRDNHLNNHPIKLVFLTGGASRMDFINDIVCEVFSYQGEFYRETDPSLTISNGIALAGRADMRAYNLLKSLLYLLDKLLKEEGDALVNCVYNACSDAISTAVINEIERCYMQFKNNAIDNSLASLERTIISSIKNNISYSSIFNRAYVSVLREEVNKSILPRLNRIVAEFFPDGEINQITSNYSFTTNISVSNNSIDKIIDNSVSSISEGVMLGLLKILGSIAGGVVAFTLAALIKIGGEIYELFTGKDADVDFWDTVDSIAKELLPNWNGKETILDSDQRAKVLTSFKENKSSFLSSIKQKIKEDFEKDAALKSAVKTTFKYEIEKYIKEQINVVRLMLN